MASLLSRADHAQAFLLPYLRETERIMRAALREFDSKSDCKITPAADLCIPHDVIRLAGGFATGCVVDWKCTTPVIPVDTTVNIDTTSMFTLSGDVRSRFTREFFDGLRTRVEKTSSYVWNFHKGNHFISLVRRRSDGRLLLLIHSNEKEFKYQFNGLVPTPGNWFMDDVRTFGEPGRPLRLLVGGKAALFARMATMLEEFNIIRHRFICQIICDKLSEPEMELHKHHYFMPTATSVAMGCYLCTEGETVPMLSAPGLPIDLFQATVGGSNLLHLFGGPSRLLVPHGWGKTSNTPLTVSQKEGRVTVNGHEFALEPQVSLGRHPDLVLRTFATSENVADSFCSQTHSHCPGRVVDRLDQIAWYNKDGVVTREI